MADNIGQVGRVELSTNLRGGYDDTNLTLGKIALSELFGAAATGITVAAIGLGAVVSGMGGVSVSADARTAAVAMSATPSGMGGALASEVSAGDVSVGAQAIGTTSGMGGVRTTGGATTAAPGLGVQTYGMGGALATAGATFNAPALAATPGAGGASVSAGASVAPAALTAFPGISGAAVQASAQLAAPGLGVLSSGMGGANMREVTPTLSSIVLTSKGRLMLRVSPTFYLEL